MRATAADRLEAKVKAVNRAHAYAHELYAKLAPIFQPLVGQKIEKVDGGLLEKYKKLLPELPNTVGLSVYKRGDNYSLAWTVKTCEHNSPETVTYYDTTVYIGHMSNGVLDRLYDPVQARTDWTAKEITELREELRKAEEEVTKLNSKLGPFGKYDH